MLDDIVDKLRNSALPPSPFDTSCFHPRAQLLERWLPSGTDIQQSRASFSGISPASSEPVGLGTRGMAPSLSYLFHLFDFMHTRTSTHTHIDAGVSIMVAFIRGSADAVKFQSGAGGTHATMTGINNRHSGAETGYSINGFWGGLGATYFVGAGSNFIQACPRIGTYVTSSSNGVGLASYIGAGSSTNSYTSQLSVQMMRFNAGIATDLFCGAGW